MSYRETWEQFQERMSPKWDKKIRTFDDIGRKTTHSFRSAARTFMAQSTHPKKVFMLERLERTGKKGKPAYKGSDVSEVEYRVGYYIVGRIGAKRDKWTWGESCPMLPRRDLAMLVKKAQKEGTILKRDFVSK